MFTAQCIICGHDFAYQSPAGSIRPTVCSGCAQEAHSREVRLADAQKKMAMVQAWQSVCPPLYRDTILTSIPSGAVRSAIEGVVGFEWQPGRRGIGLLGKTRLGKTRGLFLVLKHALTSGISIDAISHGTFSNMVRLAYGAGDAEAESRLARLYQADVVMLDDLGKAPSTERADAELELLVEHLTSHNRTILWSANGSKEWLTGRFGPDRGPALVERLREFTYVIVCE